MKKNLEAVLSFTEQALSLDDEETKSIIDAREEVMMAHSQPKGAPSHN